MYIQQVYQTYSVELSIFLRRTSQQLMFCNKYEVNLMWDHKLLLEILMEKQIQKRAGKKEECGELQEEVEEKVD